MSVNRKLYHHGKVGLGVGRMRWREEGVYLGSFGDFDPLVHNLLVAMNHCFTRVALPQSLSIARRQYCQVNSGIGSSG